MSRNREELIKRCKENALSWLLYSGIDQREEGCRSVYVPGDERYYSWTRGDSCLLCTAGCVLVYLEYGFLDRAVESASHIERLIIRNGRWQGAICSGKNSSIIQSYYVTFSILAFLRLFKETRDRRYLDLARRLAIWLIKNMQKKDGSIVSIREIEKPSLRQILKRRFHTWEAVLIPILYEVDKVSPHPLFMQASRNLVGWLKKRMFSDGSFYTYTSPFALRIFHYLYKGNREELLKGCAIRHPLSQSAPLQAFLLTKDIIPAKKIFSWMKERLSPNGLFYQFYFSDGSHSIEEDVMPTAHFGIILNQNRTLFDGHTLIEKIAKGVLRSQVTDNPNLKLQGGIRGVPGHPVEGNNLYAWDTLYALLFLHDLGVGEKTSGESD